MKAVSVIYMTR